MLNHSKSTPSNNLLEVSQQQNRAFKLLQLVDEAIQHSLQNKDPLEKFLFNLRRYCIINEMKQISVAVQTEPGLMALIEPIALEPGILIAVDSRLGWNIEFNDLYFVEKVLEDGYLVRDNGDGKAWKYTYTQFWKRVFSRQERGANAYIMCPNHPEYWTAKIRLGFKPTHDKKVNSRVAIGSRKLIRDMVDWRDMLTSQEHLIFDNGQQKLIPVALTGLIDGIAIDEIENTDFLKRSDREYSQVFAQTSFVFKTQGGSIMTMSYEQVINQKWVQIEMSY